MKLKTDWRVFLAWKALLAPKGSRFASLIATLSVLGIGAGVTALLVTLSVMDGFEEELKKRLFQSDVHALIEPLKTAPGWERGFASAEPVLSLAKDPALLEAGLRAFHPVLATEAILRTGRRVTGVTWKGVGPEQWKRMRELVIDERKDGKEPTGGVLIGQELADDMALLPGDYVSFVSPLETEGPLGGIPRVFRAQVGGIYRSGSPEEELHAVFSEEAVLRSFTRKREGVSSIEVITRDLSTAPRVAELLKERLPGYSVKDWQALQANLFFSLKLERIAMFVGLAFVIVVASFGIVTILMLLVLDRRKEISILKAMGARERDIARIFLTKGLFLGGGGAVAGALLAGGICLILSKTGLVELPEIYYDRTLPVSFNPFYYALVPFAALGISLAASRYPALRAARLSPLDGIRRG